MAITVTADNYPEFTAEAGVSGKQILLYVNYGESATSDSPVWVKVGGCESLTITPTVDVQTTQTKDSGLWATGAVSGKSFELSADLVLKTEDLGQSVIENFIYDDDITLEKKALQFAIVNNETLEYLVVVAIPTSFEQESPADDIVSYSLEATGIGAPEKNTGFAA